MDKVKMGQFLAKLRSEKNLRQQDEAEIFQISPQAISKWESGDSVPDIATLEKLSNFFNVGIDEIINGERKTPTTNVNTVVVARNPSLEERGLGKDYYGVFIFAMSALFLALLFAILPYVYYPTNVYSSGTEYYAVFTLYRLLFRGVDYLSVLAWMMSIFFLSSTLLSIGLWLDKSHRKVYWNLSFSFALTAMILSIGSFVIECFGASTGCAMGPGCLLFLLFDITYFILFCSLPICRRSRFVGEKPQQNPVK